MSVRLSQGRRRALKVCAASLSVGGSSGQMCLSLVSHVALWSIFQDPTPLPSLAPSIHNKAGTVNDRCQDSAENSTVTRQQPLFRCESSSSGSFLGFSAAGFRRFLAPAFTHSTTCSGRAVLCYICQTWPHNLCNAFSIVFFCSCSLYGL